MEMISASSLQRRHVPLGNGFGPTPREEVGAHFRARARGVDVQTAYARTKAFYRSSGNDWTLALS